MLVLTRRSEEKIIIGEEQEIVITILKVQGDKVSIGIEANKKTPIYREELLVEKEKKGKKEPRITLVTKPEECKENQYFPPFVN